MSAAAGPHKWEWYMRCVEVLTRSRHESHLREMGASVRSAPLYKPD
jgi:hypothetical protein